MWAADRPEFVVSFDAHSTSTYPHGCWAAGVPGEDTAFGRTPEEALAKYRAGATGEE